ncbi:hypothetical protein NKH77_06445 [Streptomyces sp. M19]
MSELLTVPGELRRELGRPGPDLVAEARAWPGDVLVLGAGGKTGSGIADMARRALVGAGRADTRVLAVSRWTDPAAREHLAARVSRRSPPTCRTRMPSPRCRTRGR